jgi:tRNA1Val (adenine37-N6)-methyltransferase
MGAEAVMSEQREDKLEDLQLRGLRIYTGGKASAYTTDAVLLADFALPRHGETICDLGAGSGILPLLLYGRESAIHVTGIELREDLLALARKSITYNGLDGSVSVIQGDIKDIRNLLPQKAFSLVISNPPYYPDTAGDPIRHQIKCSFQEIAQAAAWLLNNGGRLCVCCPADQVLQMAQALHDRRLAVKRLRFVASFVDKTPYLCLMEARLGARKGLIMLPQLSLYDSPGHMSRDAGVIYHIEQEQGESR